MKTSIIISALLIVGLSIALPLIVVKKNKQIDSLQFALNKEQDQLEQLKKEKEQLVSKVNDLEEENTSLQKRTQLISAFQSNANSSYPGRSYSIPSNAGATVVYKRSGCDYFILESMKGYIIAEWMGGHDPDEGETLFGNFNSYGTKSFVNGSNSESRLWIEDYWLSKEDAFEKLSDECN